MKLSRTKTEATKSRKRETEEAKAPNPFSLFVLGGLQSRENIYAGTASPRRVSKRRAKNKTARASRQTNRRRS